MGRGKERNPVGGGGIRQLAAAILSQAVKDYRKGRPCNGRCDDGKWGACHLCADDAERFLMSDYAIALFDLLEIDVDAARERLGLNGRK
jgi:hypothetical protein